MTEIRPQPPARPEPKTAPALAVTRLAVSNFRSYATAELDTCGHSVVLVGPNGAGKTNVLDALSLLAPGRGLRGAKLSEHTRHGPAAASTALWAVAADVRRGGEIYEVGTGMIAAPQGTERRQVRLNGANAASSADLGDIVQMMWLTPAMDRLFIEGASGRRKFLDRLVVGFDPAHARRAARYENAMRERARLLRFGPRDPAWLEALERQMAESGAAVAHARADAVSRLNRALAQRGDIGSFPSACLTLEGEADRLIAAAGADGFGQRLAQQRLADAQAGRTLFGPHRSDLTVRHAAKRADARECSTGEQKALLIAIVLAQAFELAHNAGAPA
ncbi:MAG: DNA replication/repair protein RecF, partial [Alphaproteobacteria bacterium]|nr:DNA replication/repair protein RecF [Alphaproteobacteria bacterium]